MKFSIDTKILKDALSQVNHATASITTTPILENILIKVGFNSIVFSSNNLEMAIEHIVKDGVKIETEGAFSLPSKIFTNYVSLINDDEVLIELQNDSSVSIKTESSNIKIKGIDATDFPIIPSIKEVYSFVIAGDTLKKGFDKTLFSAAEGNIRPTLAGVYMSIKGNDLSLASTDSFRLSEFKTHIANSDNNFFLIIPSKTAFELAKIINGNEEVKIITGENQIAFILGNTKVYSRLLNGKFPDYENFFPLKYSTKAVINKYDLTQALKKINLISRENNYSIRISFSSETGILIETNETQIGEGKVSLVGSVEGEDNIIGLNSTYFLESLGVIETTHVSISFENPLAPVLIVPAFDEAEEKNKKGEFKHIIMPLKI
ncbi:MAG: DNA polymerase III subunit beta [Candidatus Gracilibacteria bacterium]|nr:DNA polymerase III subunit beta [Candidatus Gracilibacteria bacterium]